ncbi:hypothetical protein DNFV4_02754 [Nitrospira tepida]|uniref:Uncharacterized protein n=1 Tax=Nitrospira tepida TaxID=2973512 RepID=A0AA86N0B5_9BACT|nr:hypothetical protein [Nitrospira tepida]CAI4032324.1 hypothetical protein DNFV4_02754 [Nitrospira tepida]
MRLEAVGQPIRYRWPGGEIVLIPGQPVEVEPDRARRILAKLGDRVRPVGLPQPGDPIRWDSPLFGTCEGEVLATYPDGSVLVWHPATDRLAKIPAEWMTERGR